MKIELIKKNPDDAENPPDIRVQLWRDGAWKRNICGTVTGSHLKRIRKRLGGIYKWGRAGQTSRTVSVARYSGSGMMCLSLKQGERENE